MRWYVLGTLLLGISALARLLVYPIVTTDYTYFVSKWFDALSQHPGLTAFTYPFSDYAPLYLYVLKALEVFPVYSLYSIKTVSVLFEIGSAALVYHILSRDERYTLAQLYAAFALVLCVPTFLLNSALWGQSDAVYAFLVLLSLCYMTQHRPKGAIVAFAFALSVKLQAIFFLPVVVGYAFAYGRRAVWYLLSIPGIYLATLVPAWMGGASFPALLVVYLTEAHEYTGLTVSAQSIFAFVNTVPGVWQHILFWVGLCAASAVALYVFVYMSQRARVVSSRELVLMSLLCVTLVPYLLPRMHERYFYLADLFSLLYALLEPRRWWVAAGIIFASLMAYMPFLSRQVGFLSGFSVDLRVPSALLLGVLLALVVQHRYMLQMPVMRRR